MSGTRLEDPCGGSARRPPGRPLSAPRQPDTAREASQRVGEGNRPEARARAGLEPRRSAPGSTSSAPPLAATVRLASTRQPAQETQIRFSSATRAAAAQRRGPSADAQAGWTTNPAAQASPAPRLHEGVVHHVVVAPQPRLAAAQPQHGRVVVPGGEQALQVHVARQPGEERREVGGLPLACAARAARRRASRRALLARQQAAAAASSIVCFRREKGSRGTAPSPHLRRSGGSTAPPARAPAAARSRRRAPGRTA